ncbi:MAG: hypothetical protein KDA60_16860, partial [Planctomycetales bacterium]|nr:hypothetical protein [Planctomycetales bacterium]
MAIETVVCERNLPRCLVLVRGGECPWKTEGTQWRRWRLPDWSAGVLLAALTAEPVTWDELYLAITRYQPHASWWSCGDDVPEIEAEIVAEEAGGRLWCVVDLVGRTVLASEDFPFPKRDGAYTPEEGELAEGLPVIWCEMSDDWYWELADEDWRERLEQRFQGAADAGPWPDYRAVLYGKSLDEFIASQTICIAQAARQQRGAYADARQVMRSDGPERLACTRRFHAQWLMSPHP